MDYESSLEEMLQCVWNADEFELLEEDCWSEFVQESSNVMPILLEKSEFDRTAGRKPLDALFKCNTYF